MKLTNSGDHKITKKQSGEKRKQTGLEKAYGGIIIWDKWPISIN